MRYERTTLVNSREQLIHLHPIKLLTAKGVKSHPYLFMRRGSIKMTMVKRRTHVETG